MARILSAPADLSSAIPQSSKRRRFGRLAWLVLAFPAMVAGLMLLATTGCKSSTSATTSPSPATAQTVPAADTTIKAKPLTADEIKQMKDRDDYAVKLGKALHAKMPAYKEVKIYADSWAGPKAPSKTPLNSTKNRAGDNLMLVFWSPEAGTAKGLADFTKSQAAVDAVNAGFAEFQFVDPSDYCYAQVTSVGGIGVPVCGIH